MAVSSTLEYLNLNTLRAYPLREGKSFKSVDGVVSIPNELVAAAWFQLDSNPQTRLYISGLSYSQTQLQIFVSTFQGVFVGTFTATGADLQYGSVLYLVPSDQAPYATGRLTLGYVTSMDRHGYGAWSFDQTATEFEPSTIIPQPRGLTALQLTDLTGKSYVLTGVATLQAQQNLRFVALGSTVYLNAGDGLGLNAPCNTQNPILTINGVGPDEDGNVNLVGVDCLTIAAGTAPNSLKLTDGCSKPCESCNQLDSLIDRVIGIEQDYQRVSRSYFDLSLTLTQLLATANV